MRLLVQKLGPAVHTYCSPLPTYLPTLASLFPDKWIGEIFPSVEFAAPQTKEVYQTLCFLLLFFKIFLN